MNKEIFKIELKLVSSFFKIIYNFLQSRLLQKAYYCTRSSLNGFIDTTFAPTFCEIVFALFCEN